MDTQPSKLNHELCFQLYVASKEIIRLYKPYLDELGLTYTGFLAMQAVEDQMSVSELGSHLYLDSGTLSPLLKKLEKQGLLTRSRLPEDERSVVLMLTEAGKDTQRLLPTISRKVYKHVKEKKPEMDYEDLMSHLVALNRLF